MPRPRRKSEPTSEELQYERAMVDAIRLVFGFPPLYAADPARTDEQRFAFQQRAPDE